MEIKWTSHEPFDAQTIRKLVESLVGVYRLTYLSTDGSYYVFFVGSSDKSIKNALLDHLSNNESNPCIKSHLENLKCYFRYAEVPKEELKNVKRVVYERFNPKCNLKIPEGNEIDVNVM